MAVLIAILISDSEELAAPLGCSRVCPFLREPVCGDDGVTYDNKCELEASAQCKDLEVKVASEGPCKTSADDCSSKKQSGNCRAIYQRWWYDDSENKCKSFIYGGCGGNGNNYATKESCESACRHINGYLGCPESCPNNREPLCGSDSNTYNNFCDFQQAIGCRNEPIYIKHQGECTMEDYGGKGYIGCDEKCSKIEGSEPVCGSDNITYDNKCEFRKAACKNETIYIQYSGECRCPKLCPNLYDPVCASDGTKYDNMCNFQMAKECWGEDITLANCED